MKLIVETSDERLDKFLSINTDLSRSLVDKLIEEKLILVNDEPSKNSRKLKENDVVFISDDYKEDEYIKPVKMDLDIVYEDNDIIIVNKPSGLTVHPGSGNKDNTLVNGLLYYTKDLSSDKDETRPGIVHRIDKDTSGLLIIAKNNKVHEILADDFKNKRIKREYISLVDGIFPSQTAKINAPIGKSKSDFRKQEVKENGKEATTNLYVIKRYKKHTLLRLSLETGRTHQIRVHLEYIGYPVHNDPVYNTRPSNSFGQFLHSASIDFNHPITKEHMHFDCPLPKEFKEFIDGLDLLLEENKK